MPGNVHPSQMNKQIITTAEKLGGFPIEDATAVLLKKFFWRNNTGSQTALYSEANQKNFIWQEQVCTDPVPDVPPNDFVTLTGAQIASQFGIHESELTSFHTLQNGSNVFSVQRSTSRPYLYKFNHCRLQPFSGNLDESFSGTTPLSNKNILAITIPFNIQNAAWAGKIYRTTTSGELSMNGNDVIIPTQLPYIFDNGWLNLYASDDKTLSKNRISRNNAPAVTCYVYTGGLGNIQTSGASISSVTAGFGITISGPDRAPIITNSFPGISTVNAGFGISITGSANNPTVENVFPAISTINAGSNVILSGPTNNPTIDVPGQLSQWSTIDTGIFYNNGTVIIGKEITDPENGYAVDISGALFSDYIVATSFETFSDKRLKCNISTIEKNTRVLELSTFAFNYINNSSVTEIGLIAQEVEAIAPEIVREQSGFKTIQYDRLPVLLLPVIKQQQQQIELLTAELQMLKAAIGIR